MTQARGVGGETPPGLDEGRLDPKKRVICRIQIEYY